MTSCCQWAILCFCSSQGRTKQTVTLSHANLLFSSDTAIYRLQLWIPRLHTSTRALSSLGRETNISGAKIGFDASFSLICSITGGQQFASEWSHRDAEGFFKCLGQLARAVTVKTATEALVLDAEIAGGFYLVGCLFFPPD